MTTTYYQNKANETVVLVMSNSLIRKDKMIPEDKWKKQDPRITYLNSFIKPLPTYCPECNSEKLVDGEAESYCEKCGLVVTASIEYVSGCHIILPYGRH